MSSVERLLQMLDQRFGYNNEEEQKEFENLDKAGVIKVLDNLNKDSVINPKLLEKNFEKLADHNYRQIFVALFKIAVSTAPEGSFLILNPDKVRSLSSESTKNENRFLLNLRESDLAVYCNLVNKVNERELNKPASSVSRSVIAELSRSPENLGKVNSGK